MNLAVVGHVEWVEFLRVEAVPRPGEIVHALERWEEPAGGGAVAAVQLANLNGSVHLFTALGEDELGRRARAGLEERGVTVHTATSAETQRRAFTYVDANGERTITVIGEKLLPSGENPAPSDASPNSTKPPTYARLRPNRSDSLPAVRTSTVEAIM